MEGPNHKENKRGKGPVGLGVGLILVLFGGLVPLAAWGQTISASPSPAQPLSLRRVELYFKNRRGEITVSKDHRGLKAFADIVFNGTGVLQATWEVDGRIVGVVRRPVTFGKRVIIASPDIPALPTFEPGLHRIRFRVTSSIPSPEIPTITYFVVASASTQPLRSLRDGTTVPEAPVTDRSLEPRPGTYVPRQLLVGLKRENAAVTGAVVKDLERAFRLRSVRTSELSSIETTLVLFEIPDRRKVTDVVTAISADTRVLFAQPNFVKGISVNQTDPRTGFQSGAGR